MARALCSGWDSGVGVAGGMGVAGGVGCVGQMQWVWQLEIGVYIHVCCMTNISEEKLTPGGDCIKRN